MEKEKKKSRTKDIYGDYMLPDCLHITNLKEWYDTTESAYSKPLRRMRILDGADKGKLWEVVKAKFPSYQILTDTNHMNYIKENILASVYTVTKTAELIPKSPDDIDFCVQFNSIFQILWDNLQAGTYQRKAGERAALLNLGVTQVGWRKDILDGTPGHWHKGKVVFKNIDPMKFRRDPYATNLETSNYCYYYEDYSETYIKTNKQYKDRIEEILKTKGSLDTAVVGDTIIKDTERKNKEANSTTKYHRLTFFWVMCDADNDDGYVIHEIHLLDNTYVLFVKEKIQPNMYPFSLLYCNEPGEELVGSSPAALQFANSLAYNMMSTIQSTAAYKSQRPPKYINQQSGINIRQFTKYGNDADATFVVNGDATNAVHYGQFPALPQDMQVTKTQLGIDIKENSGLDERYTGRDTGSVQGTGAMDDMLTKVSARDDIKVALFEEYTKRLAELVVNNYVQFGSEVDFLIKDPISQQEQTIKIDFGKINDRVRFGYQLEIQNYLPRNKARLAMVANMLLEKQAQYQPNPEIITVEEWLLMQDIPFKDLIFKRMGIQRNTHFTEQVAQVLTQFSDLVDSGVDPNAAVSMVADTLQQQQVPTQLGNVAGGSPQAAQQGSYPQTPVENMMGGAGLGL